MRGRVTPGELNSVCARTRNTVLPRMLENNTNKEETVVDVV